MSIRPAKKAYAVPKGQRTFSLGSDGILSTGSQPSAPAAQPAGTASAATSSKRHKTFNTAWAAKPESSWLRLDQYGKMKCKVCESAGKATTLWGLNGEGCQHFQLSAIQRHMDGAVAAVAGGGGGEGGGARCASARCSARYARRAASQGRTAWRRRCVRAQRFASMGRINHPIQIPDLNRCWDRLVPACGEGGYSRCSFVRGWFHAVVLQLYTFHKSVHGSIEHVHAWKWPAIMLWQSNCDHEYLSLGMLG